MVRRKGVSKSAWCALLRGVADRGFHITRGRVYLVYIDIDDNQWGYLGGVVSHFNLPLRCFSICKFFRKILFGIINFFREF